MFRLKLNINGPIVGQVHRVIRSMVHVAGFGFILVLPFGIYRGNPDSTSLAVSGQVGTGQYASVLRDCGEPVAATKNTFHDYSLQAHLAVPPGHDSPVVLGFGWGEWHSKSFRYPGFHYYEGGSEAIGSPPTSVRFRYINPTISFETERVGLGMGYISDRRPWSLSESHNNRVSDLSWHLRFGNPRRSYFISSFNENAPLVSGGGYFDFCYGLTTDKLCNFQFGMSFGLYDTPGFLCQARIPLRRHLYLDGAVRYGRVYHVSEMGFSIGLGGKI